MKFQYRDVPLDVTVDELDQLIDRMQATNGGGPSSGSNGNTATATLDATDGKTPGKRNKRWDHQVLEMATKEAAKTHGRGKKTPLEILEAKLEPIREKLAAGEGGTAVLARKRKTKRSRGPGRPRNAK